MGPDAAAGEPLPSDQNEGPLGIALPASGPPMGGAARWRRRWAQGKEEKRPEAMDLQPVQVRSRTGRQLGARRRRAALRVDTWLAPAHLLELVSAREAEAPAGHRRPFVECWESNYVFIIPSFFVHRKPIIPPPPLPFLVYS